jgi:ATP-dependent helicase YprA (DUF1998 family)
MRSSASRSAIEDALRTLSEALLLAASRQLDIDASEFSAGFRVLPAVNPELLVADLYLFDTLSGGAGYADQAGGAVGVILERALGELESCPAGCDRSCYNCLRHYGNQYWHEHLDRHLAAALLRSMMYGTIPDLADLSQQASGLLALRRMLELEGFACESRAPLGSLEVPLLVRAGERALAVGSYHGLLDRDDPGLSHPLYTEFDSRDDVDVKLVNEYLLTRNLPAVYDQVRELLGG